jgi:hypothetical protein
MQRVRFDRRRWIWLSTILCAASAMTAARGVSQQRASAQSEKSNSSGARGVEIVQNGAYPELHVDGAPFFIHSAVFFYYRIPRYEWPRLLERYRALGINTIDIYIPWNWHEPKEGEFDFDGHTNPRRDLRGLLTLVAQKKLKLIARPGPEILNEWRHGGYPGWLLERPEYKMNPADWLEGRYPPLDGLNAHDAEAAARGWVDNATHVSYARQWLTAAGKELAPYSSHRIVHSMPDDPDAAPRDASGPLLFVQLGDDFAIGRKNRVGPDFWRYVESLRAAIEAGGVDVPCFINPTDMRVSAAGSRAEGASGAPIGTMGQWYLQQRPNAETNERLLDAADASEIEFFTEELKTQPDFPPAMIEYQAGWYAPGDDDRPIESPPGNTLLSSRLLIGNGIHGINYFPLQDTYTPAGYSVPWANRSFRWDAALDPNGERQPRFQAVVRNSRMLGRWGPQLAASHKRADFGIVYPLGAYPQTQLQGSDIARVSESVMRIERLGMLATLSSELIDPEYQPADQLLRDPLLLLPVFDQAQPQFQMSERAQGAIVEYVRKGGTLLVFPEKPDGKIIEEMWKSAPAPSPPTPNSAIRRHWRFGEGDVMESSKDFSSWIALERSLAENRAQRESEWATGALREFLFASGVQPSVRVSGTLESGSEVVLSEIVTNEGTSALGERTGGLGFVSAVNLGDERADLSLDALSPVASARRARGEYTAVHAVLGPRESLLLPLGAPICEGDLPEQKCNDLVVAAGAEFLDAQREGKTLELLFYVPARAEIRVHLDQPPSHVLLEENRPEASWDDAAKELKVDIPRGAAPNFFRILKLEVPYKPPVPEVEKPGRIMRSDFDFFVANSIRLPVSGGTLLRTYPPIVVLDPDQKATVLIQGENHHAQLDLYASISIEGDLRGSGSLRVPAKGNSIEKIRLKPPATGNTSGAVTPGSDGLLHGKIEVRAGKDDRIAPIAFLPATANGTSHYRYDFDGDGADEWVLENSKLRVFVSPESGGEVVALVDKATGANLASSVGLLRDSFSYTENATAESESRPRGHWGLSNRAYAAEWPAEQTDPAVRLRYGAPDVFPAGASIDKMIRLEGADAVRVDYRVGLNTAIAGASQNNAQSFVALNSFSAVEAATQFCWGTASETGKPAGADKSPGDESTLRHCEDFVHGGKPIRVPDGETRVEIRTPGRPGIAMEWTCDESCARLTIEPKNFSALFHLEFPPIPPGSEAKGMTMRFRLLE